VPGEHVPHRTGGFFLASHRDQTNKQ
jgi:hypothetical protein